MTDAELQRALDKLKATMISVATDGARIGEVEGEFAILYDDVDQELQKRRIENTLPYRDLWAWYGRWSSGDLPTWQSRRVFVNGTFEDLQKVLRRLPLVNVEPTGWQRVDRAVTEIRNRLAEASTEEQFQAVGLLCREVMISLAQEVFNPQQHETLDGVKASKTDAKRMLEAYIAVSFAGSGQDEMRKFARSSVDLAVHLQHRRTASFRDAAACVEATTAIINLIAVMQGLRDPSA